MLLLPGVAKSVQEAQERGMLKTSQGWTEFQAMGPDFAFSSGYWIWHTKDGAEGGKFKWVFPQCTVKHVISNGFKVVSHIVEWVLLYVAM